MSDIIVIKGTVPNANFFFCHCLQGYFSNSYARILMSKPLTRVRIATERLQPSRLSKFHIHPLELAGLKEESGLSDI